jgi:universal stress protein E
MMPPMRILCATDLLPGSEAAVERAGLLSDRFQADLTLLHIVAPVGSEPILEQTLQTALTQMTLRAQPPQWHAQRLPAVGIRSGSPPALIVDTLEESKHDLLVVGPPGKRPLRNVLEGTIVEKALAARTCPVLIVRHEPVGPYRRVLLAVDLSGASASVVRAVEVLILTPEAEALIVHAYEPPYMGMLRDAGVGTQSIASHAQEWTSDATRAVRHFVSSESRDLARYEVRIEQGPPAAAILRLVEAYQPDLLVMGTRGGGRVHRALLGSVAIRVLSEIECDALVVPAGTFDLADPTQAHR